MGIFDKLFSRKEKTGKKQVQRKAGKRQKLTQKAKYEAVSAEKGDINGLIKTLRDEVFLFHGGSEPASALKKIGLPALPALIQSLKDENEDSEFVGDVIGIILEIVRVAGSSALPVLIENLKWQSKSSQRVLIEVSGNVGAPAVPFLINLLTARSRAARRAAALALAEISRDAKQAIDSLIGVLNDDVWEVRRAAIIALAAIAPKSEKVKVSLQALITDNSEEVQLAAKIVLGDPSIKKEISTLRSELYNLCSKWENAYTEAFNIAKYHKASTTKNTIEKKIRKIGLRIHRIGGEDLMHEIIMELPDRYRSVPDSCWDGIGKWLH